jgi:hypothetical protein
MVFILLAFVACQPSDPGAQTASALTLALDDPQVVWQNETLGIRTGIEFVPSMAVSEALSHGVAVTLVVETRIHPWRGWLASQQQTRNHRFEIRYLPLSEHYQLTALKTGITATYPRLRLLLADLSEARWLDTHLSADKLGDKVWQVQARVAIDKERMPAPMQVSVWTDEQWQTNSSWWTWEVSSADGQGMGRDD